MLSPLAIAAHAFGRRLFTRAPRSVPLYGVTLHTTGSGILDKDLQKTAQGTLQKAMDYYASTGGPHYVVGWDGRIGAVVQDENMRGAHAGIAAAEQSAYYGNTWRQKVSPTGAALWDKRWPGRRSPADLLPNGNLSNVNDYWLGIEMIPITYDAKYYFAEPAFPGSRFTKAQLDAAKKLSDDIARRHGFPSGWKSTPRFLGHSDLNPIERDTPAQPLWDPPPADLAYVKADSGFKIALALAATAAGLYVAWRFA